MSMRALGFFFLLLLPLVEISADLTPATVKPGYLDAAAFFVLGTKYFEGAGVSKDDAEAIKYFRKAAELGDTTAQNRLGTMLVNGEGVPKDYVEASAWHNVAASGGMKTFVENRDALEKRVGIEATLKAQARSRELVRTIGAARSEVSPAGVYAVSEKIDQNAGDAAGKAATLTWISYKEYLSKHPTKPASNPMNIGVTGVDAHWSEFGGYLNELLEVVQTQWYTILKRSRLAPPKGSHVIVTFHISAKGKAIIAKVEDVGAGKLGVAACQHAIMHPQPYRKWTEQMVAVLDDPQQITLSFYYQ